MQLTSKDLPLPGFIGVGGTAQRIGPGFLGMMYAPFTVQNPGQPPANIKAAEPGRQREGHDGRLRRRQRLFYNVEDNFTESSLPAPEERRRPRSRRQRRPGAHDHLQEGAST